MRNPWMEALLVRNNEIIEAEITKDGLLIRLADVDAQKLLANYEKCGTNWWWDNSYNRYIAEKEDGDGTVTANPKLAAYEGYDIVT